MRVGPSKSRLLELRTDREVIPGPADVAKITVPGDVELEQEERDGGARADAEAEHQVLQPAMAVGIELREPRRLPLIPGEPQVGECRAAQIEDTERHRPHQPELLNERKARLEVRDRHPRATGVEV